MKEAPAVVVFDFDLTLTRWDMSDRFFRWLLRRERWRRGVMLLALPVLAPLWLSRRTRLWVIRFAVWVATLGRRVDSLPDLAERYIDTLPDGHASAFVPAALARLREHLDRGDRVVIATGCLEPLARALLVRAGFGHVPLVASTLKPFLGGLARGQHCFGRNKVPMLAAQGFVPPWAAVYTDHHADLPLLAASSTCYLVSPTPESLARIKQVLAAEATILVWR